MDRVRLDVRETSRNSEKPKPKARTPPMLSVKTEYRRGVSSVTRNSFSEELSLRPGGGEKTMRTKDEEESHEMLLLIRLES